jgi:hypothetical protein
MDRPICPYCRKPSKRVSGKEVYPHRPDLGGKRFYLCSPCGAWVGCHERTGEPFGRLANAALRRAKQRAHAAFDPIWENGPMDRGEAYAWLASELGIAPEDCHIGLFDEARCLEVVKLCDAYDREDMTGIVIENG